MDKNTIFLMQSEVSRISHLLQQTYAGDAWHGSSVKQVLQGINAQQAAMRVLPDTHTIWELISHITVWRTFAFQKMAGDKTFDILTSEQDWPLITDGTESKWLEDLQALDHSQSRLVQAVNNMIDQELEAIVPGRQYSFYTLLHGIIQHDLYHTGQIALLKKHIIV
jgi:uncharacterized damage-inducible protein DinB